MDDAAGWDATTWAGNRRRQHDEFRRLPLREKIAIIEQMGDVVEFFAARRRDRGVAAVRERAEGEVP